VVLFRQVLHPDLGCASYVIADTAAGLGAVVDPKRDVAEYLELAATHGFTIAHVIETHNHADHVSGRACLAEATGARSWVSPLAGAGYPLGIVTAGRSDRVGPELRRHGIDGLFGAVVYGDDHAAQKPHPAPLRSALDALGRTDHLTSVMYIGDTPDDMRMAVAAGVRGIGIESILGDQAELRAAGAAETAATTVEWLDRRFGAPGPIPAPATRRPA
jgi:phosphoglycolate phosphatase-like HAD superfamily hydrolase